MGEGLLSEGGRLPGLLARGHPVSGAPEVPGWGRGTGQETGGILPPKGSGGCEGQARAAIIREVAEEAIRLLFF